MEYYSTLFNNSNNNSTSNRGPAAHNGSNSNNNTWESWELSGGAGGVSRVDWSYPFHNSVNYASPLTTGAGGKDQLVYYSPDPHLTSLKLGKRHYFEHVTVPPMADSHLAAAMAVGGRPVNKKGKPYLANAADATMVAVVPRCQVEGCDVVLVNAKEYHRRHKVCEMHAKAPKVVVLGMEQRFCQQCSRFHAVAEFDDTKRSCRRRLAGHNERRRKSSQEQHSLAKKVPCQDMKMMIGASTHPHFLNSSDRALSLLSSPNYTFPYNIPNAPPPPSAADLPSRCSAALRELIAENRASILACRQLINPSNYQIEHYNNTFKLGSIRAGSDLQENGGHVTLDLMQAPNSAFNEEDCSELWKVPLGNY